MLIIAVTAYATVSVGMALTLIIGIALANLATIGRA